VKSGQQSKREESPQSRVENDWPPSGNGSVQLNVKATGIAKATGRGKATGSAKANRERGNADLGERLEHLHQAIEHLHEGGFHEQGRHLEEIAAQIHRRLDGAEREHGETEHAEREHAEREQHEGGDQIRRLHGAIEELHGEIRRLQERFNQIERELEERRR